jgi:hypothetical protein
MNNLVKRTSQQLEPRQVELEPIWDQDPLQPYDPYWNQRSYTPSQYIMVDTPPPQADLSPMNMMARSLQNVFQMQMTMLRELDTRMNRLEQARPQSTPNAGQFYAQTWWALWGILMLILGSALVVVILLILRG